MATTRQPATRNPNTRRNAAIAAALVVVLATGAVAVIASRRHTSNASKAAPSVLRPVQVTSGSLATTESVNGSVVLDDVTNVLHRIEGQNAVTVKAPSTGTTSGNGRTGTSAATGAAGLAAVNAAVNGVVNALPPGRGGSGAGSGTCNSVPDTNPVNTGSGPTTTPTTSTPTTSSTSSTSTTTTVDPSVTSSSTGGPTTSTTSAAGTTTTQPCVDSGSTTTTSPRGGTGGSRTGGTGSAGTGGTGSTGSTTVTQVVTSVITVGSDVRLGTILYSVESRPVVAMAGSLPAWRTLKTGITDGPDVRQLELSLVALGYDRDNKLTVDEHFDSNTKAAVERWQTGYGLDVTGSVTLGSVVFLPAIATVSAVSVTVGQAIGDGTTVLSLTGSSQQVVIAVPTGDESFVVPGLTLKVGTVEGTVTELRSVVQNGTATVEAVITPAAPLQGTSNGATVKVTVTRSQTTSVLLVPSAALASRLDGTYAVQVVGADGSATWVTVTVAGNANGETAIKGDGITTATKVLQAG